MGDLISFQAQQEPEIDETTGYVSTWLYYVSIFIFYLNHTICFRQDWTENKKYFMYFITYSMHCSKWSKQSCWIGNLQIYNFLGHETRFVILFSMGFYYIKLYCTLFDCNSAFTKIGKQILKKCVLVVQISSTFIHNNYDGSSEKINDRLR